MQPPPGSPPGGGWGPPPGPAAPPGAPPGPMGWGGGAPQGPPGGYGVGLPPGVAIQTAFPQSASTEPMGIISIVLGVISIPLYMCCGIFAAALNLFGVVLGFVSMSRINARPELHSGKGLAIAGLVVNGLFLILNVLLTLLVFGVMGIGILSGP